MPVLTMAISYTTKKRCPAKSRTVKKIGNVRKCASDQKSVYVTTGKRCKGGTVTLKKAYGLRECGYRR
jgi:hypothetical protein